MQRLFLSPDNFTGDTAIITGEAHHHLTRVMRGAVGDSIVLLDNSGKAFHAVLRLVNKNESEADLKEIFYPDTEPEIHFTVAQALGKGDKFEQVVQHGTEVGASAFIPIRGEHSLVDIPANRLDERLIRWRRIAQGAAEQSFRAKIPLIGSPLRLHEAIQKAIGNGAAFLLLDNLETNYSLANWIQEHCPLPNTIWIGIGPEGGWSEKEREIARVSGCPRVSVGNRILRTETAALVTIAQILFSAESS